MIVLIKSELKPQNQCMSTILQNICFLWIEMQPTEQTAKIYREIWSHLVGTSLSSFDQSSAQLRGKRISYISLIKPWFPRRGAGGVVVWGGGVSKLNIHHSRPAHNQKDNIRVILCRKRMVYLTDCVESGRVQRETNFYQCLSQWLSNKIQKRNEK